MSLLARRPRPRRCFSPFHAVLSIERLEERLVPASLVLVGSPSVTTAGYARVDQNGVTSSSPTALTYEVSAEATLPDGTLPESNAKGPGGWVMSGSIQIQIQADSPQENGRPVDVTVQGNGEIGWDLDPMGSDGWTTSTVELSAGADGDPAWFDISGGQDDPDSTQWSSSYNSGNGNKTIHATVGSTITVFVNGNANSNGVWVGGSGDFHGEVSGDLSVNFELALPPQDVDASDFTAEWQQEGGAEFQYSVVGQALTANVPIQVFWANESGPIGSPIYNQSAVSALGTHNVILSPAMLHAPPPSATRLLLKVVEDNLEDSDLDNNEQTLEYDPSINNFKARYDGNPDDNVIGRFFSGISISDETFSLDVSDDLAALKPTISLLIGTTTVSFTQSGTTFTSKPFDPGTLTADTKAKLQVMVGGVLISQPDGTPFHQPLTFDMESVPTWMKTALSPTGGATSLGRFDTATESYVFSGNLINIDTAGLKALVMPKQLPFAAGTNSGMKLLASTKITAPLDTSVDPTETGHVHASLTYLGRDLLSPPVDEDFPSDGDFNLQFNLKPQTLEINSAMATFHTEGTQPIDLNFGKSISPKGLAVISYDTSDLSAEVDYSADLTVTFTPSGTINPLTSKLDLNMSASLSGTIDPEITTGSKTADKVAKGIGKISKALNIPSLIIGEVKDALQSAGLAPKVSIQADVGGTLDLSASVQLTGSSSKLTLKVTNVKGHLKFQPAVKIVPSWFGESVSIDAPQSVVDLFAFDIAFP